MDNFDIDNLYNFNFKEFYIGIITKVNNDNSCFINIPMLMLGNDEKENNYFEGKENFINTNIENDFSTKSSFTTMNSILCLPFSSNYSIIKPNKGDKVTVFFINGDPNKPRFIEYSTNLNKDSTKKYLFKTDNISVFIEDDKLVIQNKNKKYSFSSEGMKEE